MVGANKTFTRVDMRPSEIIRQQLLANNYWDWEENMESGPKAMAYVRAILNFLDDKFKEE